VSGVQAVVHLAAFVQPSSREFDRMWRVNVDGTRALYAATAGAGCVHFVHFSSAGIYGHPRQARAFHENDAPHPTSPYQRTKWEAELALREADPKNVVLNILRPAGIYGAGSYLELPTYRRIMAQRWSLEPPGAIIVHPTHIQDVVQALLAILETPAPHGMVLNFGGERSIRYPDFEALVAKTLGVPRRRITLPARIAGPITSIADPLLGFLGRPDPRRSSISRGNVFSSAVDDGKFRQHYPTVPRIKLEDGLRDHIDWAFANRLLT